MTGRPEKDEREERWKEWWALPKEERERRVAEMFPIPWHLQLQRWLKRGRRKKK